LPKRAPASLILPKPTPRRAVVLAADSDFKLLACNTFEGDDSRFDGTPAISDGPDLPPLE